MSLVFQTLPLPDGGVAEIVFIGSKKIWGETLYLFLAPKDAALANTTGTIQANLKLKSGEDLSKSIIYALPIIDIPLVILATNEPPKESPVFRLGDFPLYRGVSEKETYHQHLYEKGLYSPLGEIEKIDAPRGFQCSSQTPFFLGSPIFCPEQKDCAGIIIKPKNDGKKNSAQFVSSDGIREAFPQAFEIAPSDCSKYWPEDFTNTIRHVSAPTFDTRQAETHAPRAMALYAMGRQYHSIALIKVSRNLITYIDDIYEQIQQLPSNEGLKLDVTLQVNYQNDLLTYNNLNGANLTDALTGENNITILSGLRAIRKTVIHTYSALLSQIIIHMDKNKESKILALNGKIEEFVLRGATYELS